MPARIQESEAIERFNKNFLQLLVKFPGAGTPWLSTHTTRGREVAPTYSNVGSGHAYYLEQQVLRWFRNDLARYFIFLL